MKGSLKKYKFIDLFAGIGGFHIALGEYGARCVFASEWDKKAANVYNQNFGILPAGDITQIAEKEIPPHDILCAGFPCQAFSVSGNQLGFKDTRGTLFFDIARIVQHHKPSVLLLENVKNLVRHDKGNTFEVIKNTLDELGYNVYHQVLNASNFGLPQNRERIFIVCFRKDIDSDRFEFPSPKHVPIAVENILETNPDLAYIERDDISFYKKYDVSVDESGNEILLNKPIQIGIVNKGGQGERIYHIKGHGITLSAYGGGVGAKTGLFHIDGKIRKLSPRECARMQGFPDTFRIDKSSAQAYKQFGNSVPINIVREIVAQIIKIL